jgi:hypothetical protein
LKAYVVIRALGLTLMLVGSAGAEERQVIRDEHGRRVGTIEQGVGERQVIRDEHGRRVGAIEPGVGGGQVIRDEQGRRVGTTDKH